MSSRLSPPILHGPFEIVDETVPLICSSVKTQPPEAERVVRFCKKF